MGLGRVLNQRAVTNGGLDLDERGLVRDSLGFFNSFGDSFHVLVTLLHVGYMPSIGLEALDGVLRELDFVVPINGHIIVVIQANELPQLPVAIDKV